MKEEIITTEEIIKSKEKYDTEEAFTEFTKRFAEQSSSKYIEFSEHLINSYLGEFGDKVSTTIYKLEEKQEINQEVEILCTTEKMGYEQKDVSYCTVHAVGKKPIHLGYAVPKDLFKDFVLLSLAVLTEDELKHVKSVKLQI